MRKCVRCGKSFLTCRRVDLKDSHICSRCFADLGFGKDFYLISRMYSYDEIKDGYVEYYKRKTKRELVEATISSASIKMTGGPRDLVCTEEERQIFEVIKSIFLDYDPDENALELMRLSDNYLTAKYGEWDLARFKYTIRSKWILFPAIESSSERHLISSADDVKKYADLLAESFAYINS